MTRKAWIYVVPGLVLVAVLYWFFRPHPAQVEPAAAAAAAAAPHVGAALRQEFALTVQDGKLASGPSAINVTQGTEVTLRIRSDRADVLHIHGYDLHVPVATPEPAQVTFVADRAGRFEYELHEAQVELGVLQVQPAEKPAPQ